MMRLQSLESMIVSLGLLCLMFGCGVNAGNPLAGPSGTTGTTKQPDVKNLVPQLSITYTTDLNPLAEFLTLRVSEVVLYKKDLSEVKDSVSIVLPQVKDTVFLAGKNEPATILENVSLPEGKYERVFFVVDQGQPGSVKGKTGRVFELELETFVDGNGRRFLAVPAKEGLEVKNNADQTLSLQSAPRVLGSSFDSERLIVRLIKWVAERVIERRTNASE